MKKRFLVSHAVILAALAIVSCSSRHVAEKPDTTLPSIMAISPANGATAVDVATAVTCTFSEAMNASTINEATFLLERVTSTATTTIAGTVTYDALNNVATFTTISALEHNTLYTATITTVVTDAAGNAIAPSFSWSFTTIPAPGALDTSFGTGGMVTTALGSSADKAYAAYAATIQMDGKIVTAGYSILTMQPNSTTIIYYHYFTIARFQPIGALDTTFGFTQNGWSDDIVGTARAVAVQSDGKIVAAGDTGATEILTDVTTTLNRYNSTSDFLIARYNANGTLDPTFGPQSSGTVTCDMSYDFDVVRSLAIQTDGKIVVAGEGKNSGSNQSVSIVARFTQAGSLDASFNSNGKIVSTPSITSSAVVVKIQPTDGMIVVGGNMQDASGLKSLYLSRYDSNGAPDLSFNSGMATASPGTDPVLADIAILPDGKIIVAGTTNESTNADVFLMRFNANGTLDTTFGTDGTVISDDMMHGNEVAAGLVVQADGKIVVAATFQSVVGVILTTDFALFRYSADGVLDTTTFGNGFGMVTTDLSIGNDDSASDVQIQQDGKIVVVGTASNAIGMARYWP
ncbi:MAG: Ig-like domain-containing protein [Nitrospirae bacterium]|nr:Ig-like domain-containing protein [Nitrospirota bacterium]